MPAVSIIIPVHNTAGYLEKCVGSVRSQTLEDIEIILAENVSDDGSAELCDRIAEEDRRIKVIHLDIAGLSHARNCGFEIATGKYIGYVDSDDFVDRDMFRALYDAAEKYGADIAYCNYYRIFPDGSKAGTSDSGRITVRKPADVVADIFTETVSSSACTKIFRRDILNKETFPEGRFFEDHTVMYRLVGDCKRCVWVDRSYYAYYQREDSICHTLSAEKEYHFFLAESGRAGYIDRFPEIPQSEKDRIFTLQTGNSLGRFKAFLKKGGGKTMKDEMDEMRGTLISAYRQKNRIGNRTLRQSLFKIKYLWPIYRLTHSGRHNASPTNSPVPDSTNSSN